MTNGARTMGPTTGSRCISSKRSERTVITTVTGEPGPRPRPSMARNSPHPRRGHGRQLLGLVHRDQQPPGRVRGESISHSPTAPMPSPSSSARQRPLPVGPPRAASRRANLSKGRIPGSNGSGRPTGSRLGQPGRQPGTYQRRFPRPEGPTTTTRFPSSCPRGRRPARPDHGPRRHGRKRRRLSHVHRLEPRIGRTAPSHLNPPPRPARPAADWRSAAGRRFKGGLQPDALQRPEKRVRRQARGQVQRVDPLAQLAATTSSE